MKFTSNVTQPKPLTGESSVGYSPDVLPPGEASHILYAFWPYLRQALGSLPSTLNPKPYTRNPKPKNVPPTPVRSSVA